MDSIFFLPIANQINDLRPFTVNQITFFPKFFSVKADNKAAHEMIVDIPKSFISTSCRRCLIHYNHLKTYKTFTSRDLPDNHVFAICTFFSTNLYSFCWFHDLCEGVIEKLMHCILKNQPSSYFEELNLKIQSTCKQLYKKNKLSSFKVFKNQSGEIVLKGTGIQKLHFFLLFSIITDNFANNPESNEFYLYFILRKIINFCSADEIYKEDLNSLKSLSSNFLDLFINTFKNESVIFKMHYLEHYDDLINEFSLLMLSSTLVYERVNQKVIRSTEGSRNYVDLALQIFNNFTFKVEDCFKINVLQEIQNFNEIDDQYKEFFKRFPQIQRIQDCDLIVFENMKVKLSNYYLYKYKVPQNQMPLFIQVTKIFYINNMFPLIIGRLYAASRYSKTYLTYKFKDTRQVISITPNEILYHKKLTPFTCNENLFIIDNFYVRNDPNFVLNINVHGKRV